MRIDLLRIERLADFFKSVRLAESFSQNVVPSFRGSEETALYAILWAAAICHSTKGGIRGRFDGIAYHGWDYLLRAFLRTAESDCGRVAPESILRLNADGLDRILTLKATDAMVTLPDLDRRAEILRGLAGEVLSNFGGSLSEMLKRCDGRAGGPTGAYEQLGRFRAFRDPLRKKSSVFLMAVHFAGIWIALDQDQLFPMIDYHRLRILCRTGCIVIDSSEVLDHLRMHKQLDKSVEVELRDLALEVCRKVVQLSNKPMFEFDILLWGHARSCCRHQPVCAGGDLEDSSFYSYIMQPFVGRCEFEDWCLGRQSRAIREIWEPTVVTEDY